MKRDYIKADNCPLCNKEDAARMGSTSWGHKYLCCSNECGYKLKDILIKLYKSNKWKKLNIKLEKIQNKIMELEHKAIFKGEKNET